MSNTSKNEIKCTQIKTQNTRCKIKIEITIVLFNIHICINAEKFLYKNIYHKKNFIEEFHIHFIVIFLYCF